MSFEPAPQPHPEPAPQPDQPTTSKPGLFHGLEDLPAAEREFYERQLHFRPTARQVNRYVRVEGDDHLSRGYCEAIARELETNPQFTPVLQRVERNANRYAQGFETSQRLGAKPHAR